MSKYIPLEMTKVVDPEDDLHVKKDQLFDLPMRLAIIGKSLISSKTTTLEHFFARPYNDDDTPGKQFYRKNFKPENMYIVCPTMDGKMKLLIEGLEIPSENVMTEYNEDELNRIVDEINERHHERVEKGEKPEHSVIIMDDVTHSGKLREKVYGVISRITCNMRHALISLVVTAQYYAHLPPVFRTNATGIIMFEVVGAGLDMLIDEHNKFEDKRTFRALFKNATSEPRKAFVINYTKPERYFDGNFMPLIMPTADEVASELSSCSGSTQCTGITKKGDPCKAKAKVGDKCGRHS